MSKPILAPSVLSANFSKISQALAEIKNAGATWVHLDVMDGSFVPNITFGPKFISDIRFLSDLFFDTHLMIENPQNFIEQFAKAGSQAITVHYEACTHLDRTINQIKSYNCLAGVAIVPSTPVSVLQHIMEIADLILIMSVNPGFGGQVFIPYCLDKIKQLKNMREDRNFLISVDGGINEKNFKDIKKAGADVFIAGSAFFNCKDKSKFVSIFC